MKCPLCETNLDKQCHTQLTSSMLSADDKIIINVITRNYQCYSTKHQQRVNILTRTNYNTSIGE